MRAVIIEQPGVIRVDDVPESEVGPKDELVKVAASGTRSPGSPSGQ